MLRQLCPLLLLVALALGPARCHAMAPQISATRSEIEGSELREKRGIVTIDLGMILKNLLLKSAQFSSAKASLTHPTKRPTTTKATTTTTTTAPPVQPRTPPPPRQKPIWQPHGYYSFGYLPFDYETDYGDPVAKAQAQAPQSGSPGRPLHPSYLQRKSAGPAAPARYEYDYDYDAPPPPKPTPTPPPPPSLPQRPHPRPRPRPRPQPRQPLPEPQQIRRPSAQLGDRLVYQYAQPTDTYYRPSGLGDGVAAQGGMVEAEYAPDAEDADGADGADAAATADNYNGADENGNPGADPPWFLVNYANENDVADFSRGSSSGQKDQATPPRGGIPVQSSGYV